MSLLTLASRILGFARDSAMAAVFGLGEVLDAFTLAFRIPNLARSLFGEGALTTAFLPAFLAAESRAGKDAARKLATAVGLRLAVLLVVVVISAEIGLAAMSRSVESVYQQRLIQLLAIMTPYLLLICLAALGSAMLQAQRRFLWPATVPVLLNLWWLAAVGMTAALVVDPERRIRWIAASLLVGGVLQLLLPTAVLFRSGWTPLAPDNEARLEAKAVFRAMFPTVAAASITQFNTVLDSLLAWIFAAPAASTWSGGRQIVEPGTAAALYFAQRLYQFPMGLIGVAVGTVLFPTLAAHAARKDFGKLKEDLTHGLNLAMSVALPASGGLVVLAGPVTTVLFQHGRFTAEDGLLTSRIMAIYGSMAWAAIALLIIQRGFFAVGDRRTPLKTGLSAAAFNLVLTPIGAWFGGGLGLAASTAATTFFQLAISLWLLQRHAVAIDWPQFRGRAVRALGATIAMMAVCAACLAIPGLASHRVLQLGVAIAVGGGVYLGIATLMGLQEPFELILSRRTGAKNARTPAVEPSPDARQAYGD